MLVDHGVPPVIPEELRLYNSYVEDPKWQIRFTVVWCSILAVFILLALPRVVHGLKTGAIWAGIFGVRVAELSTSNSRESTIVDKGIHQRSGTMHWLHVLANTSSSLLLRRVSWVNLDFGQLLLVSAYTAWTVVSIFLHAPLLSNPNRAGFLALAQLPPVFHFAMKNSPLAFLLGPDVDYTKLNFIHRWSGRGLFLGALIHGAIWIQNHLTYNLPILTRQKEGSGVAALATLTLLVLTSISPLRRWCCSLFITIHYITFPTFFILICYHTRFAYPWIYPPLAFFALDLLLRLLKFRIAVASIRACDGGLSIITIPTATAGWRPGQHVQLRTLGARPLHAHPLSILCAPPDTTCLAPAPGLVLAARVYGPWSRAVFEFAAPSSGAVSEKHGRGDEDDDEDDRFQFDSEQDIDSDDTHAAMHMHVILDGPYGGPTHDAGTYDAVLFLAGGSGATATLGLLDDLVGRCVRRGRPHGVTTRRVVWVWCVRDADALKWFAPHLAQIAAVAANARGLDLRIRVFVTGAVVLDADVSLPRCEISYTGRLAAYTILDDVVAARWKDDAEFGAALDEDSPSRSGRVGVFAAGPSGLVRDAGEAVARTKLRMAGEVDLDFCAEAFVI
ncbi:iron reductase [Favolaschia claudopus]|uniref:Iron reductase n=1 Tax=Favolaschia claudopus TaxID=2862362 RepID=A0AAW0CUV6_9AGAR